jgi:hypothetical protein
MARTITGPERTLLGAQLMQLHTRFETANGSGTMIRIDSVQGLDMFDSAIWEENNDASVMSGSFEIRRDTSAGYSLAPLMGGSILNRNDAAAYSALLKEGRRFNFYTAVTALGVAPVAGDWKLVFPGKIDKVNAAQDPIKVEGRDIGAFLADTYIDFERIYANDAGVAVETVMQQILNDNGWGSVVLYTPVSPGWMIRTYKQEQKSVLEALRDLALQIGWELRYRFDAAGVFRLTFYQPTQAPLVAVDSYSGTEYLDVTDLSTSDADVRNVIRITYTPPGSSADPVVRTIQDPASIAEYKVRFLGVRSASTSNINTTTEADDLGARILAILKQPPLFQEVETLYSWHRQLGDVLTFVANGVHYDSNQTMVTFGLKHEIKDGDGRTHITCTGSPIAQYKTWIRKGIAPGGIVLPSIVEVPSRTVIGGLNTGVLDLTVSDPSNAIETIQFSSRSGDTGAWSAWATDTAPYQATVVLVPDESSAIRYQVYGMRPDGSSGLLQGGTQEFPTALKGYLETRIRLVSSTALTATYAVDGVGPAGTTPVVQLVAVSGSASLNAGAAPGTSVASGSQWTFNRGQPLGGSGGIQFRTLLAGYQSDDDTETVNEQGRDTVSLQTRLIPATPTATTQPLDLVAIDPTGDTGLITYTLTFVGMATVNVNGIGNVASGYTFTAAPGTLTRITTTRPLFSNAAGRLEALATKSGRTQDSDSQDVAPQDRDTILPTGRPVITENGAVATLNLYVTDPQGIKGAVEAAYAYGNRPLGAYAAMTYDAVSGSYYVTMPLIEKQVTRVEWRISALYPDGSQKYSDSGTERTAAGSKPSKPELKYSMLPDGRVEVTVRADNDTTQIRAMLKADSPPSAAEVHAAASFAGRNAAFTSAALPANTRFYMAAFAYNAAVVDPENGALPGWASDIEQQSDIWSGPSTSVAKVKVGRAIAQSTDVTFDQISFDPLTSLIEVYVEEHTTQPDLSSIVGKGYRPPGAPLRPGSGAITALVSTPGNWIKASFAAVDAQNRYGADETTSLNQSAGVVTVVKQSSTIAVARPSAPTNLALAIGSALNDVINLTITMPATPPAKLRIFRDGSPVGTDVLVTAGANATQLVQNTVTPGATYSYQVYGVDNNGILSGTGSPIQSIATAATTLPTPSVSMSGWSQSAPSWSVTITPGAGTPTDGSVTWHVEMVGMVDPNVTPAAGDYTERSTRTVNSFSQAFTDYSDTGTLHNERAWIRVWGEAVGYAASARSAVYSAVMVIRASSTGL